MRFVFALLSLALVAAPSYAADKTRISVQIVCNDRDATAKLANSFTQAFAKAQDYELVDKLPQAKLMLYANKDVNSRKNPEGWSIAIAWTSNVQTYFLASKLNDSQQADAVAVKPIVTGMVNENGFIKNLTVAHVDDLSDTNVQALGELITAQFIKEMAGVQKR